jgi:hypothetical protein
LVRRFEGKKYTYKDRWKENIKVDLKEEWIQLVQNKAEWWALVNIVTDLPFHIHSHRKQTKKKSIDQMSKCQFPKKL